MNRRLRHTCKLLSQCTIIIAFITFCSICSARDAAPLKVYVIPIAGEVGPGLASFLERAIRDSDNVPENIYVLEMDTFGGRVDSALQIVDLLINVPKAKTIAFVKTKAISAGALIALACRELVMRPNTTLGDCAPITYSSEGVQVMGEKFQSPLRAKFRTLARRNGYPPTLAEAMVTAEMEVYRVELAD
jgi:membrane-bound serine protease (ClpP class)